MHVLGQGYKRRYDGSVKEHKEKYPGHGCSFITIKNQDNSCCARAIITAKSLIDNHSQYKSIRKGEEGGRTIQKRMAEDLLKKSGLPNQTCGFPEIQKMQKTLGPLYQIKVWDRFRKLLFQTNPAVKVLHLYLDKNHFDVIGRINQFHNASYFCESCNMAYKRVEDHNCKNICTDCRQPVPCEYKELIFCPDCNRNFRSQSCYNNHCQLKSDNNGHTSSICQRIKRCGKFLENGEVCGKILKRDEIQNHHCGHYACRICGSQAKINDHKCYMQKANPLGPDISATFIIFDLETQQKKEYKETTMGPMYLHEPNLCIAYKFCDLCKENVLEKNDFTSCKTCGPNRFTFEGPTTTEEFGKWLFIESKGSKKNPVIALAHNARGFDTQFLLNFLTDRGYLPKIIPKGQKIMQLETGMVTIKDSLNFLPMPLSALPKSFGFDKETMKGYFPHFFNCSENEDYEGPLPAHHYYGTSTMTQDQRDKFFNWYNPLKEAEYTFNLKIECWNYCNNDVFICAKAIMKFRDLVWGRTNVDPLLQVMTIASTTMQVYRQNFLTENTIGLIPPGGYREKGRFGNTALKWLKYISANKGIHIQHARNGGEKKIPVGDKVYMVDGYAEVNGQKIIYEFYGCK